MNSHNTWQVSVQDRVYEASYEELVEWIKEGAVLPDDKVKRGNLRWLNAGKIPELYPYFQKELFENERENYQESVNSGEEPVFTHFQIGMPKVPTPEEKEFSPLGKTEAETEYKFCSVHPDRDVYYVCEICGTAFCKACPNTFGSSVKICVGCGGLCVPLEKFESEIKKVGAINKPYPRVETVAEIEAEDSRKAVESINKADVFKALSYPLKYPLSFLICAAIFSLLIAGQAILAIGGSFLFSLSALVAVGSVMLLFSTMFKVIENSLQHKPEMSFLPKFSRFTIWEDFVHPVFLGIGVYLVAFGLFAVLTLGAGIYAWTTFSESREKAEIEARLSKDYVDSKLKTAQQNLQPNKALENAAGEESAEIGAQFRNVFGNDYLADTTQLENLTRSFMRLSVAFHMPVFFAFLFGVIIFPAICAAAGSTRSLAKTLNLLSGFRLMKKIGFDYIKIQLMNLIFLVTAFSLVAGVYLAFSFLGLQLYGILFGLISGSLFTFYFWLAFSRILGAALYKKTDYSQA
jgi:uncharacterized protein (DUF2062 family)